MKTKKTLTLLTRRDKGSILDDLSPAPAQTVSSPDVSGIAGSGGALTPTDPCSTQTPTDECDPLLAVAGPCEEIDQVVYEWFGSTFQGSIQNGQLAGQLFSFANAPNATGQALFSVGCTSAGVRVYNGSFSFENDPGDRPPCTEVYDDFDYHIFRCSEDRGTPPSGAKPQHYIDVALGAISDDWGFLFARFTHHDGKWWAFSDDDRHSYSYPVEFGGTNTEWDYNYRECANPGITILLNKESNSIIVNDSSGHHQEYSDGIYNPQEGEITIHEFEATGHEEFTPTSDSFTVTGSERIWCTATVFQNDGTIMNNSLQTSGSVQASSLNNETILLLPEAAVVPECGSLSAAAPGTFVHSVLTLQSNGYYKPAFPVNYYVNVFFDGMPTNKYTVVDGMIAPYGTLDSNTVVSANYVVG